jgi:hypothetical protein
MIFGKVIYWRRAPRRREGIKAGCSRVKSEQGHSLTPKEALKHELHLASILRGRELAFFKPGSVSR